MKPLRHWLLRLRPLFLGPRKATRRFAIIEWDLPEPDGSPSNRRRH
ncbi:hypothetical protein [Phragmitibacter flavus]|nr:hypothetical protein [Phragmitibacter flavus]